MTAAHHPLDGKNALMNMRPTVLPAFLTAALLTTGAVWADPQGANHPVKLTEEPSHIDSGRLWTGFAGGPDRSGRAGHGATGPDSITSPRWIKRGDENSSFVFYGQAGVVVSDHLAIAVGYESEFSGMDSVFRGDPDPGADGSVDTHLLHTPQDQSNPQQTAADAVVAFSRLDGSVAWIATVPMASLESWSTPCVDERHQTVIVGTGTVLTALSLEDGAALWSTPVGGVIVNASPVVTQDLNARNRAFVTTHSYGSGINGRLVCINTSPFDAAENPYDPGEVIWSVDLGGQTSGNTPAYDSGVVFVATATGGAAWDQGTIRAFRANATSTPQPLWVYEHTDETGFFSGVGVHPNAIYASTYAFHGGQYGAQTVRLDRHTGAQVWSVATNRTDTVPVVVGEGLVLVSGGLPVNTDFPGFGSLPSVQLIFEHPWGSGATRLWDSAMSTHQDTNGNGQWDRGEYFLSVGGWTNQPVVFTRPNGETGVYVGSAADGTSGDFFGPSPLMALIDPSKLPHQPGFIIESIADTGGSPAMVQREVYAVGADGLHAFGAPAMTTTQILQMWSSASLPDMNGDGVLTILDFYLALQYASD